MATTLAFLQSVDATSPSTEVLDDAGQFIASLKFADGQDFEGVSDADIDSEFKGSIACKAFLKRAFRLGDVAAKVKRQKTSDSSSTGPSASAAFPQLLASPCDVTDLVGHEASASVLARLLAVGQGVLDVTAALAAAGMTKVPYTLSCESLLWKVLRSDVDIAAAQGRKPFTYIDLTSKETIPLWLPQDAIGGKGVMGSDWAVDPSASSSTLAQLGQALQSATAGTRFFRSFTQWLAAWNKYNAISVATTQLTWTHVHTYLALIVEMMEHQRLLGESQFLPILYDDLFRRQVAKRAEMRDPTLDFALIFAEPDKTISALAKSRLDSVLKSSGVVEPVPKREKAMSVDLASSSLTESILVRQQAAAEATMKRAEAATRALSKQQEELLKLSAQHAAQPSGSKGAGKSARQVKRKDFYQKAQDSKPVWPTKGKGKKKGW